MIRENIITAHRRLFGRCEGCNRRLGSCRPRVLGYEWIGWLSSEAGLWHLDCLERKLGETGMQRYENRLKVVRL